MIATTSRRSVATREQWSDPRRRARLLASQLLAAERRRVDRLVETHLHLLPLAGGHGARLTGLDKDDLTQAAYPGLLRAAETWDPTRGASFASWAYLWMRATVQEEVFRMRSAIRVPRRSTTPIPKVTSYDVSQADDGSTFAGLIEDSDAKTPIDAAHSADLREQIAAALATLNPRDALVVELHFGLNGASHPHSYVEIGARLGVCTQRAAQLERRALGQLRVALVAFAE